MKAKITLFFIFSVLTFFSSLAQEYDDYIGAGHSIDVTVTSSDANAKPFASVNGEGLDLDIQGASRFLYHTTMGYTIEDIEAVTEMGFETWLDNQMDLPASNYTIPTIEIVTFLYDECIKKFGILCPDKFQVNLTMWRYAFWHNLMRGDDQLRQKIAMALSEVLVLSDMSELRKYPHGVANYYDILAQNAFGNYKDILREITLNPSMGFYLSHINNPKTVPLLNIRPDENYAREFMQLFTIGLYELQPNGERKVDMSTGLWIPTYDNEDIKGLAKVFTGLSGSKWSNPTNTNPVQFGRRFSAYSLIDPMIMYEEWHEPGEKTIVGGYTIPDGQGGMMDIEDAIDHIFNHENVGPFIGTRLIQRLVKSNPSPQYIERITNVFNDNGSGVRGDLAAVVKAIFLDQEAMDCFWNTLPSNGVLRPPMLRLSQLLTGLKAKTESDWFWNSAGVYSEATLHHTMSAPTVFNFYAPDYVPNAEFAYDDMVSPEFQILNSSTSSNYVNYMLLAIMTDFVNSRYGLNFPNILNEASQNRYIENPEYYDAVLSDPLWLQLASHPEELVDYLDILLANGDLSQGTKDRIVSSIKRSDLFDPISSAHYAAFLIMTDPEYVVKK